MVIKSSKKSVAKPRVTLAKGQIWKTKDTLVQIVELGKVLVHYKMMKEPGQMRRTQMSRVENMEDYLRAHNALLVQEVPCH